MGIKLIIFIAAIPYIIAQTTDLPSIVRNKLDKLIDAKKIKRDFEAYYAPELTDKERYDFIIVGAGSAGSALINRLSEEKRWKILVLEAGGEPNILTDIPMWGALSHFSDDQNWGFLTEKEENFALGFKDQRMRWPRGKGLGGTSLLNYMVASRGVRYDYDKWASLGNPGWSYEEVLPLFKRFENCKIQHQDEEFRGHNGEVHVEDSNYRTKGVHAFLEAAQNVGYKYVDYNGREHVGVSYIQTSTKNGLRCSGERCFIRKARNRKNLTIRLKSHVSKVLIDDEGKKAHGVEFIKDGKKFVALADKEVILSAGVINSAHILLLSGIGPKKDLDEFGITTIKDLPVGKKIYDHPTYWGLSFTAEEKIGLEKEMLLNEEEYTNLFNRGTGRLHNIGGVEGVLFSTTPLAEFKNLTDIEILYWSTQPGSDDDYGLGRSMGISQHIYNAIYKPLENSTVISAIVMLMRPESYGYLQLQSSDPFVHPKIYGGYLTDPERNDIKTLIAGIREAIRVFTAEPLKKYGVRLVDTPIPGCEREEFDSDEYWECALRHLVSTIYHHTTTCKMGPSSDPEAVVDHDLKVYGVGNLRVADTSVIPVQISGHTNFPAYMIGEKAADVIKEAYPHYKFTKVDL